MSSLSAACADGYYIDPESHGKRKKSKSNQFEKNNVIRFELMFSCWCVGCGRIVEQGTRFNAKKERTGAYFSTPIFTFHMKCASCDEPFSIRTDPKNTSFEIIQGLRRMRNREEADIKEPKPEMNPFSLLDVDLKCKTDLSVIQDLIMKNERSRKEDATLNAKLRAQNRIQRNDELKRLEEGNALGLAYALLPSKEEDSVAALSMPSSVKPATDHSKRMRRDPLLNFNLMSSQSSSQVIVLKKKRRKRKLNTTTGGESTK